MTTCGFAITDDAACLRPAGHAGYHARQAEPRRIYCIRCSGEVKGPVPAELDPSVEYVGGFAYRTRDKVQVHTGHVDARKDTTCGTWGFRRERQSDRDT